MPPRPASSNPAKPVAAVFRSPLFNASETFVQRQALALHRYRPLFVGLADKGNVDPDLAGRILLANNGERIGLGLLGRPGPIKERLAPHAPALVHAHFGTDGLLALPLAKALDLPLVTTLHGYDATQGRLPMLLSGRLSWMRYALLKGRLMAEGALFLAVSEAIRQRAVAQGFPTDRTVTHYIGVDLARFRPLPERVEPGLILHVGRLVEKKGTADLIAAFARVRRGVPGATLAIVGDGRLRPALERQAAALGLGDAIRFLGSLAPDEVLAWMQRAWLIAAPSVTARSGDSEGLPTVLVEAAACGLPAVATDHSGIPEVVQDQRTGLLVSERDVVALADRIVALLGSVERRQALGAAARAFAEERFDLVRQTATLENLYDGVRRGRCG